MKVYVRWLGGIGLLTVLLGGQWALSHHLQSGPTELYPELKTPLEELAPKLVDSEFGSTWVWPREHAGLSKGFEAERTRQLQFLDFVPDAFLLRLYVSDKRVPVSVNLVHSRDGFDRKHHPEICVRDVLGLAEEAGGRRVVSLPSVDGRPRPVQRFGFRKVEPLTVYYWHYSFLPVENEEMSSLQFYNRFLRKAPPSVTVQVWLQYPGISPAERERLEEEVEAKFLPALDAELRSRHLPERVAMNCNRVLMGLNR